MLLTDNSASASQLDVVAFVVFDDIGQTLAYGSGPLLEGQVEISPLPD